MPLSGSGNWLGEPKRWVERDRQAFATSSNAFRAGRLD
jgi:hypothetical protein